jgi:hypothetical protein
MSTNTTLRTMEHELGRARASRDAARSSASMFGMYDDCGPEYQSDYREACAIVEYLEKLLPRLREQLAPPPTS